MGHFVSRAEEKAASPLRPHGRVSLPHVLLCVSFVPTR